MLFYFCLRGSREKGVTHIGNRRPGGLEGSTSDETQQNREQGAIAVWFHGFPFGTIGIESQPIVRSKRSFSPQENATRLSSSREPSVRGYSNAGRGTRSAEPLRRQTRDSGHGFVPIDLLRNRFVRRNLEGAAHRPVRCVAGRPAGVGGQSTILKGAALELIFILVSFSEAQVKFGAELTVEVLERLQRQGNHGARLYLAILTFGG